MVTANRTHVASAIKGGAEAIAREVAREKTNAPGDRAAETALRMTTFSISR
jgi:hypothetical protein